MSKRPKASANSYDNGERQTVADVHRTQKISWLAVEVETAGRTTVIHLGETPVNAGAENPARPAPWAELPEDAAPSGSLGMGQEDIIANQVRGVSTSEMRVAIVGVLKTPTDDNLWLSASAPIHPSFSF